MGYAVYMNRLSFTKTDAQGIPIADPEVVEKGGRVPDYVKPFEIHSLRAAGMIVDLGDDRDDEDDGTPRFTEQPPALPNPEIPPTLAGNQILPGLDTGPEDLPGLPGQSPEPTGLEREQAAGFNTSATQADEPAEGEPEGAVAGKPSTRASKQEWEDYAVSRGVDRAEAESMTKSELIARVEGVEQA